MAGAIEEKAVAIEKAAEEEEKRREAQPANGEEERSAEDSEPTGASSRRGRAGTPTNRRKKVREDGPGKGHDLYKSGVLFWCRNCGSYAQERFRAPKEQSPGDANRNSKAGQQARMINGWHPFKKGEGMPRPVRVSGWGEDSHAGLDLDDQVGMGCRGVASARDEERTRRLVGRDWRNDKPLDGDSQSGKRCIEGLE